MSVYCSVACHDPTPGPGSTSSSGNGASPPTDGDYLSTTPPAALHLSPLGPEVTASCTGSHRLGGCDPPPGPGWVGRGVVNGWAADSKRHAIRA